MRVEMSYFDESPGRYSGDWLCERRGMAGTERNGRNIHRLARIWAGERKLLKKSKS
jgi:hypothetical protein